MKSEIVRDKMVEYERRCYNGYVARVKYAPSKKQQMSDITYDSQNFGNNKWAVY